MAQNKAAFSGTPKNYKANSGGAALISEPVLGIVKNNIDPSRSGRIQVFIANVGAEDPNDNNNWITVSYLSPFYGISTASKDIDSGTNTEGYGKFVENPQSYGFWATAPDIGTEVVCVFIGGDPNHGFYIGCVPKSGLLQMTPGLGSNNVVVPNEGEAKTYGGADRLPVGEVNYSNTSIKNSPTIATDPKPIQSYQASILLQQGLLRDNVRGVISSSAQRETPSRVFGMSTPGRTIYQGGYNNSNIKQAAQTVDKSKLQAVGKTGGHSVVMDDGTIDGKDQLMRFRTADGHQIIMNDSGQTLFIIHANGQSWIELGKEGTIDMFSTNSVNIRTQGDLNLHADRDVNINAKRNFNFYSKDANIETDNNLSIRAGATFAQYSVGRYTVKADGDLSLLSGGAGSLASAGTTYINGNKVNLNTGNAGTIPAKVPVITKVNHLDTAFSTAKGWMYPSPTALISVTSRTPAHQPWAEAGKGVDVTVSSAVNSSASVTTDVVDTVNRSTSSVPKNPVSPSIAATVPTQPPINDSLGTPVTTTLVAQQAMNNSLLETGNPTNSALPATDNTVLNTQLTGTTLSQTSIDYSVYNFGNVGTSTNQLTKRGEGILLGPAGVTLNQATAPGQILKPGSQSLIQARLAQGMPYEKAIAGLVTGNFGANNPTSVLQNLSVQTRTLSNSMISASAQLRNAGILTGLESAGQAGGLILSTANYGIGLVTGVISGIGNTISGTITTAANTVTAVANTVTSTIETASNIINKTEQVLDSISSGKFAGQLSDTISNGLSGLASSVGTAITNAVRGIGKSIAAAQAALVGTLRNAFNTVEQSFQDLTKDVPNVLGGGEAIDPPVDPSSASAQYAAAEKEIDVAEEQVFQAKKAYRNNPDSTTYEQLQSAEQLLSTARQRGASASSAFLGGGITSALNSVGNTVSSIGESITGIFKSSATTENSGINSLPGGINSAITQVQTGGKNIVENVKGSIKSVTNADSIADSVSLAGNLVENTVNGITGAVVGTVTGVVNTATNIVTGTIDTAVGLVTGAVNTAVGIVQTVASLPAQVVQSVTTSISGVVSSINSALSAIGRASGQIKSAITATETFVKTEIVAKQGQVLNDDRIPAPLASIPTSQDAEPYVATSDTGSILKNQATAQKQIREAEDEITRLNARRVKLEDARSRPVPSSMDRGTNAAVERSYQETTRELAAANNKLNQAERDYQSAINTQNSKPASKPEISAAPDPLLTGLTFAPLRRR